MALGVICVNYGSHELLDANLDPGLGRAGIRVVVVDNLSNEAEREAVTALCERRGWELVAMPGNPGFGEGVNAGVARARELGCDGFVALNPDAVARVEVLAELHAEVRRRPRALVSPMIVRSDGRPWFRGSLLDYGTGRTRGGFEADGSWQPWLTGACLAFSVEAFDELDGFAPGYFLYWEDVDISRRAVALGMELVLRRDLEVVHDEGGTQTQVSARGFSGTYYYWNARNRLLFAARNLHGRELLRWILATPAESRQIVLRGGRRQFLQSSVPLVSTARGTASGLRLATGALLAGRRASFGWRVGRSGSRVTNPLLTKINSVLPGAARRGRSKVNRPLASVLVAHPSPDMYGSDRVLLESVDALRDAGTTVTVALPGDGPLVAELERRGARVVQVEMPVLRKSALKPRGFVELLATAARSLPTQVRLVGGSGAELVLVNTITIPMWSLVARIAGRPSVVHVHEAEAEGSRLVNAVLYAPLNLAGHLVANSAFTRDVVAASYPWLARRTTVVHNGVPGPEHAERLVPGPVPHLLYVGRLSPRKGPDVAVRALGLLRDQGLAARLSLLGNVYPGYEWFEAELRELVARLGLDDQVDFLGFDATVWPHLAQADIALVPSVGEESFGNTAVEALLAARPLVVSRSSGLAEATDGYRAVRQVTPDDPQAIADAVRELWADIDHQAVLAVEDSRRAWQRHSPEAYRAAFLSALGDARR